MKYMQLGATQLRVARVCLGTAGYGAGLPVPQALEQLDLYRENGGNFLDTARCYNDWIPGERSRSEKTLGKWLSSRGCRAETVLSTKGGHPPFENMHAPRLSPQELDADLDGSLRDLGTDYIDLYFLHRDDERQDIGEILEYLEEKVRQGKILHYGCSNWSLERIQQAEEYAGAHSLQGFTCNQVMWSLAETAPSCVTDDTLIGMDEETYAYHQLTGMSAMAYSSQGKGYFARAAKGALRERDAREFGTPRNRALLAALKEISAETGVAISTLTVHYITASPFPAVPIVSSSSPAHLLEALAAADLPVDAPWVKKLSRLRME